MVDLIRFRTFFIGLATFCLLLFLSFQIKGVDLNQHNQVLGHIRGLKQLETKQNQQVLELRMGFLKHYDSLSQTLKKNKKELSSLKKLSFFDASSGKKPLLEYEKLLLKREQMIQDFSGENALLNNSLFAFPKLAAGAFEKKDQKRVPDTVAEQVSTLSQKVLLYVIDGDVYNKEEIVNLVSSIEKTVEQSGGKVEGDIGTLLRHAEVILSQKPIVDNLVRGFVDLPTVKTLEEIDKEYFNYYQKRIKQAKVSRFMLFGFCLALLTGIGYVLFQLKKSSQNMRNVILKNADAITVIDQNGKILFVNPAAERLFGRSSKELLHKDFGYPALQNETTELQIISLEGKPKVAEMRVVSTSWKGESAKLATLRDITERKGLEEQLLQSQKMDSLGHLTAGISHDFNNLLTVIKGYAEFLLEDLKEGDSTYRRAEEIYNATKRASNLTKQLLAFSRTQVVMPKVFDLNRLILDMEKMLKRLIGEDVELVTNPSNDLGFVKIDPSQMEQILLNLAVNARDALPKGGKLTIETKNFQLDQKYTRMHPDVKPGEYILLSVSDNGSGMPDEVKKKIFDPFFTTKEKGKGTGLGLSTCYGIVKQAQGNIQVYSEQNQGTTFRIYLPRCHEPKDPLICEKKTSATPRGDETILIVEDEESVRKFAVTVLRNQGYQVFEATNGAEALRIAEAQGKNKLHLLVTDVVMPQMNGQELVERIQKLRNDTRALFISGYTDDTIIRHGILEDKVDFLQKPFGAAALAFKVREVLDR